MGFIKTNYDIEKLGITLPEAYAQINRVSVNIDGSVSAIFSIQQKREDINNKRDIDTVHYRCKIDKDLPLHKQVYEKAKADIFSEWEDDIVE